MSEFINNRENKQASKEEKQRVLKELILELHNGKEVVEVKTRFAQLIEGISPSEIAEMEQSLIMDGMPIEEVQRLCDVHAEVFKGAIEEVAKDYTPEEKPGHPIHTLKLENREIERIILEQIKPSLDKLVLEKSQRNIAELAELFEQLWQIDKHYSRKENLVFPYLEKYNITAPPKVMWGVDDEIRDGLKNIRKQLAEEDFSPEQFKIIVNETLNKITEMIFKEENILFPMSLETLTEDEWVSIAEESSEIGYSFIQEPVKWIPERAFKVDTSKKEEYPKGALRFETGVLTQAEINSIFNNLPVDITFIDKDDVVKYFSNSAERVFARTKAVIGRTVQNCHPPGSVHVVEKMLEDFKSGKKNNEDFWIKMGDLYVLIRYYAVRNEIGEYIGTMEVTQNIKPIQAITGEKRLLSE